MHFPEWRIGWWFCLSPAIVIRSFVRPSHLHCIPRHALVLGIALPGDDNEDGSRARTCPCQGLSSYHHTMYLYVDAASGAGMGIGIMDFVVVGGVVGWMGILSRWVESVLWKRTAVTVITQSLMSCSIVP